jgi:hypothetical protein
VDGQGASIDAALVSLPLRWTGAKTTGWLGSSAKSDAGGNFVLTFPSEWLDPGNFSRRSSLWAYAPGHSLSAVNIYKQLFKGEREEVEIKLGSATDTAFRIIDPRGASVKGAIVEPWHWSVPNYAYDIPPDDIRAATQGISDSDGIAKLPAVSREGFRTVQVTASGFGVQQLQLKDSDQSPALRAIRLRPVGRLEIRVTSSDAQATAGLRVGASTEASGGDPLEYTAGEDIGYTNEKGQFFADALAEGATRVLVTPREDSLVLPRLPENVEVRAGELTAVEIPLEPGVPVRGLVRSRDGKPVPNVLVYVHYGVGRQGAQVRSDAQGQFRMRVLAGPVYQQAISIPGSYVQIGDPGGNKTIVPESEEPFDLPSVELVETRQISGRLVDQNDEPIAGLRLNGIAGNRRYGFATTANDGSFTINIPPDVELSYQVWSQRQGPVDVTVIQSEPLVLRARVSSDVP